MKTKRIYIIALERFQIINRLNFLIVILNTHLFKIFRIFTTLSFCLLFFNHSNHVALSQSV